MYVCLNPTRDLLMNVNPAGTGPSWLCMVAVALESSSMHVGCARSCTGSGVVLHAVPEYASQDCQRRVGYGDFPPPLAICQQLSARRAGTGRGVDKQTGSLVSVGSVGLR